MKFHVVDHPPQAKMKQAVLALHVTQDDSKLPSMAAWIDKELKGGLKKELKRRKFTGAAGSSTLIQSEYGPALLVGVGKRPVTLDRIRQAAAVAVKQARTHHFDIIATPATGGSRLDHGAVGQAVVEGALLGDYSFDKYKDGKGKDRSELEFFLTQAGKDTSKVKRGVTRGQVTAAAQNVARDLANEPASILTPRALAARAKSIGRASGLSVSVMGPREIERLGMGAFRAVSLGSDQPPQLIKVSYRPRTTGNRKPRHIVLVGKSITYDSGGINLKPSRGGSLEMMKADMAGGAAVLGAMSALKRLGVTDRVTAYLPATENMLGDGAYKPGDVLKTYNGKTIEVGNTDAEGRLTLADVLAYASAKDKPDELIDLATLTATDIALGPDYAAIFATKPQAEEQMKKAGEVTGEYVWPLPFPERYDDMTKSAVADYSNITSGRAYTLAAPVLLRHFVGKNVKSWIHLDIGGPSMLDADRGYQSKGGTGYGTRLLLEYLTR